MPGIEPQHVDESNSAAGDRSVDHGGRPGDVALRVDKRTYFVTAQWTRPRTSGRSKSSRPPSSWPSRISWKHFELSMKQDNWPRVRSRRASEETMTRTAVLRLVPWQA